MYLLTPVFSLLVACSGFNHHDGATHGAGDDHHHNDSVGVPGKSSDVDRTLEVVMNDSMQFIPASFNVKAGETIRFALKNNGAIEHEMVIGNAKYLLEHNELMKKFPGMEHEEANMLLLDSSGSGDLI